VLATRRLSPLEQNGSGLQGTGIDAFGSLYAGAIVVLNREAVPTQRMYVDLTKSGLFEQVILVQDSQKGTFNM
jgi:hypothetical protein